MHQTISAKLVRITSTQSCPAGHTSTTTLTARATLTASGPVVHHPTGVATTSCRTCPGRLGDAVLAVPDGVRADLNAWATRRGLPVATEWTVAP